MFIRFVFIHLFLATLTFVAYSQNAVIKSDIDAKFPGGSSEMYKFLAKNIKYPSAAIKANVSGRVFLSFIVNVDGSLESIKILRDPGFGIGREVVRVVKSMPKWQPGTRGGISVPSQYHLPVFICPE